MTKFPGQCTRQCLYIIISSGGYRLINYCLKSSLGYEDERFYQRAQSQWQYKPGVQGTSKESDIQPARQRESVGEPQ